MAESSYTKGQSADGNHNKYDTTDNAAKSKSHQIEVPTLSLPKGGGAIKSIDDKFQVNAANGTAGYSIPFPFSKSRNDFMPNMTLSYNSGSGNGIFGLGWNAEALSITRKTEKKLPEYKDAEDSDTFVFSGMEDLVPALKQDNSGNWIKDETGLVKLYKPRIEGRFARIEKITETTGNVYWKVTSKDNIISVFGKNRSAQVYDLNDPSKIFKWMLEFSCDDKGSCIQYEYKKENKLNVENHISESNRLNDFSKFTNTYLKSIKYCNKTHFHRDSIDFNALDKIPEASYFLELVLDYGEHDIRNPKPDDNNNWSCRKDAFSEYRAGFEIRTYRLCQRLLMFHHFTELGEEPYLVRSVDFEYKTDTAFTFLRSIQQKSYEKKTGTNLYAERALPPVEFSYQALGWNTDVISLSKENMENLPVGLDDKLYQWVDLYGEGISGILSEQADAWYYKKNKGDGDFESSKLVTQKPSFKGLSSGAVHLQDVEANGQKFLVSNDLNGYFELGTDDEWQPFKNFTAVPNINMQDPNLKFLDLNGDGKADILISEENVFVWYASKGKEGFESSAKVAKSLDEEKGPSIVFADSTQSILLADMSGDGLMDIVRIRNSNIAYWPNLGYGKFGAKVNMDNAPLFDTADKFNANYVKLADLDGSGIPDIVYLGNNEFKIYFNQSGNSWSEENIIQGVNPLPFPKIDDHATVNMVDLLGNGTACIVWSSPLPVHAQNPLRYIDLMGGKKPHVMTSYKNNMGKEVSIEYKPSTFYYLEDKAKGNLWVTKLPFPVQCVSRTIQKDKWRNTQFSNQFFYHHGCYDYAEREFRGFGRVEQIDAETFGEFADGNVDSPYITQDKILYQPPVMTKTWYHTGAFLDKEKILSQFEQEYFKDTTGDFIENKLPEPDIAALGLTLLEYKEALRSCKGMPLRQEVYELDVEALNVTDPSKKVYKPVKLFSAAYHNCHIQLIQPQHNNLHAVFLTTESEAITYNYELDLTTPGIKPDPRIAHTLNVKTDEYGNVLESLSVVYPRIGKQIDNTLPPGAEELIATVQQRTHISYMLNKFTNDVITEKNYRLRLPCEVQTFELTGLQPAGDFYFSLKELKEITENEIQEIPYHRLPDNSTVQKRVVECVRITYFRDDLKNPLPFGEVNALALPYETYKLALTKELLNEILGEKLMELKQEGESNDAMLNRVLTKGGYHFENGHWWIRSGIAGFADDGAEHFYLPEKYTDPFGNVTTLQFDEHDLYIKSSKDAVGNRTEVIKFDFRVLAPLEMKDINENRTEVKFDILGMPAAMALKGKGAEGDEVQDTTIETTEEEIISFFTTEYHEEKAQSFLANATARYVYYLGELSAADGTMTYENHPACAAAIVREKHVAQSLDELSPVLVAFQYSDGSGTVLASKVQAEPDGKNESRWITNGKTILNNKGKPVKQYEPYFTDNHHYEEPLEIGVTSVIYYDAIGRVIRTEMPDGTYSRVEFTPWFSKAFDQNDTQSGNNHYDTPAQKFSDALGRDVIAVAHNKWQAKDEFGRIILHDEKYLTYTKLDAEGKPLWVRDARGNKVMQYVFPPLPAQISDTEETQNHFPAYDIAGNLLFQHSMDNGSKWMIMDAAGKPYYSWDENERQDSESGFVLEKRRYTYEYDGLHRPTQSCLTINEEAAILIEKIKYGESIEDKDETKRLNLLGQPYQHFDGAGIITNKQFDFKGNLLSTQKQIVADYKAAVIDWQDGSATGNIEPEIFLQQTEYDALNRMTRLYNWYRIKEDGSAEVAVYEPKYNRRGILETEDLIIKANKTLDAYSGGTRTKAVSNINYDAKGQLQSMSYANGTKTKYTYDEKTFRLIKLRTTKRESDTEVLQNLSYTYDAVGNITEIYDDAYEPVFFNNQKIEPRNTYVYDALYRLISATGRENNTFNDAPGQKENAAVEWESMPQTDSNALRNYTQSYIYDAVGNIIQMRHIAGNRDQTHRWTRTYTYADNSNRLLSTETGGTTIDYNYDTHGSMRNLANVGEDAFMQWDHRDMIHSLDCLGGGKVYYQYDSGKQRSRKLIERNGNIKEERWYLGGMEWYRKTIGTEVVEEIETHHLFVGEKRILIVEDVIKTDNTSLDTDILYRYQYSNHLGSVGLEADETGNIISYEEYHPYGTPAYTAKTKNIKSTAKRYRYTGMERDEESGLNYHSARYYAPWLGRWCSSDPIGLKGGYNLFVYCSNNPYCKVDPSGTQDVSGPSIPNPLDRIVQETMQMRRQGAALLEDAKQYGLNVISEIVQGDFHEGDVTIPGTAVRIIAGTAPILGQVTDIRDGFAAVRDFGRSPSLSSGFGVLLAGVAFVPGFGDTSAGVGRYLRHEARDISPAVEAAIDNMPVRIHPDVEAAIDNMPRSNSHTSVSNPQHSRNPATPSTSSSNVSPNNGHSNVNGAHQRPQQPRNARGQFQSDPSRHSVSTKKHNTPEYRRARAQLRRDTIDDPNAPTWMRDWFRQEKRNRGNNPENWRNPPGYDAGHINPNDNSRLRWEMASQNRRRGAVQRR